MFVPFLDLETRNLHAVIHRFNPEPVWMTQEGAVGQCERASSAFAAHCLRFGVPARRVQVLGLVHELPSSAHPAWRPWASEQGRRSISHHVVAVHDMTVDWTARQFNATADFPEVRPVQEFIAAWQQVFFSCATCGWNLDLTLMRSHERMCRSRVPVP